VVHTFTLYQFGAPWHSAAGFSSLVELRPSLVAFSPDGRNLVGVHRDYSLHYLQFWDIETGRQLHRSENHSAFINSVTISADGRYMLTASYDRTARIWDAQTGRQIQVFVGHRDGVQSAVFSMDSKRTLTASTDGTVRSWDTETAREVRRYKHPGPVKRALMISDDKRILAHWETLDSEDRKTYVSLWAVEDGREIKRIRLHRDAFAITPDGQKILTASEPTTLSNAATGEEIRRYGDPEVPGIPADQELSLGRGRLTCARFSPEGRHLLTTSFHKVAQLWDLETGGQIRRFAGHTGPVRIAAFSPDGKRVLTGAGTGADLESTSDDDTARLWDVTSGSEIRRFEGHSGFVHIALFSPDGSRILTASAWPNARLWDVETGKQLPRASESDYQTSFPGATSFSPDGSSMLGAALGSMSENALLWDVDTRRERLQLKGHVGDISTAVFSPDGKHVLTASIDGTVRIWDVRTGEQVRDLPDGASAVVHGVLKISGHVIPLPVAGKYRCPAVKRAQFSGDGKVILTASADNIVRLWETDTGKEIMRLQHRDGGPLNDATLSADAKRVLTKWQSRDFHDRATYVSLWDTETGREIKRFELRPNSDIAIFSPDGKRLLTTTKDTTLWNSKNGRMIKRYK